MNMVSIVLNVEIILIRIRIESFIIPMILSFVVYVKKKEIKKPSNTIIQLLNICGLIFQYVKNVIIKRRR
jgi:hypothetical protein